MHSKTIKNSTINMVEGPLFGKIIKFILPLIATSILQLLYNAADVVVVGKFAGDTALAAVGSTSALINLIFNVFIGLGNGASVCAANAIGARDDDRVKRYVHTALAVSFIGGIITMIVGFFLARPMLSLMNTDLSVIDSATLYVKIFFLGAPANLVFNFVAGLLRAAGDTKRPLYILSLSGIVNVLLNLLLVIVFHMDVAGVAIATIVSQYISVALVLIHIMRLNTNLKYTFKKTRIHKKEFIDILKLGIPSGFQGMMFSLSTVMVQSSINTYARITEDAAKITMGAAAEGLSASIIAGNTAAGNIEGFIWASMNTLHQAAQTFTSQNLGAGKVERVKKVLGNSLLIVTFVGIVMGIAANIFDAPLLGLYTSGDNSTSVIEAGINRLRVIAATYFLCGIMDVFCGVLRGLQYSISSMLISLISICAFRIIWLETVFKAYPTSNNIYITYPISWILATVAFLVLYIIAYKRTKQRQMAQMPQVELPKERKNATV